MPLMVGPVAPALGEGLRSARAGSPSVHHVNVFDWSSGTSVNGLPMNMPGRTAAPSLASIGCGVVGETGRAGRGSVIKLVTTHQRRDGSPASGDRPRPPSSRIRRSSRAARVPVRAHVHVGVREDRSNDGVAVAEHPLGQDAVEVERYDDRDIFAEDRPGLLEEVALGIELPVRPPSTRGGGVDAIDIGIGPDRGQERLGQGPKTLGAERPVRDFARAPKPATTVTPGVASNTSSAPPTSRAAVRCDSNHASPSNCAKSCAWLGTGLKVETSWTSEQMRIRWLGITLKSYPASGAPVRTPGPRERGRSRGAYRASAADRNPVGSRLVERGLE